MHRAILHDPEAYSDPETFSPQRFLRPRPSADATDAANVELDPTVRNPMVAAFGFGRRICPGRHMAYESLWIAIASVVAAFNITKAVDAHGTVIEPSGEYTDDFLSCVPLWMLVREGLLMSVFTGRRSRLGVVFVRGRRRMRHWCMRRWSRMDEAAGRRWQLPTSLVRRRFIHNSCTQCSNGCTPIVT